MRAVWMWACVRVANVFKSFHCSGFPFRLSKTVQFTCLKHVDLRSNIFPDRQTEDESERQQTSERWRDNGKRRATTMGNETTNMYIYTFHNQKANMHITAKRCGTVSSEKWFGKKQFHAFYWRKQRNPLYVESNEILMLCLQHQYISYSSGKLFNSYEYIRAGASNSALLSVAHTSNK